MKSRAVRWTLSFNMLLLLGGCGSTGGSAGQGGGGDEQGLFSGKPHSVTVTRSSGGDGGLSEITWHFREWGRIRSFVAKSCLDEGGQTVCHDLLMGYTEELLDGRLAVGLKTAPGGRFGALRNQGGELPDGWCLVETDSGGEAVIPSPDGCENLDQQTLTQVAAHVGDVDMKEFVDGTAKAGCSMLGVSVTAAIVLCAAGLIVEPTPFSEAACSAFFAHYGINMAAFASCGYLQWLELKEFSEGVERFSEGVDKFSAGVDELTCMSSCNGLHVLPFECEESGSSRHGESKFDSYPCLPGLEMKGRENYYYFSAKADGILDVSMESQNGDFRLILLKDYCLEGTAETCIEASTKGLYSSIEKGSCYTIIVDSPRGAGGEYTLTCNQPLPTRE